MERQSNQLMEAIRFQIELTSEGGLSKRQEYTTHSHPFILTCLSQYKTYGIVNAGNCPVQQDTFRVIAGAQRLVVTGAQNMGLIKTVLIILWTYSYQNCSSIRHDRQIIICHTNVK